MRLYLTSDFKRVADRLKKDFGKNINQVASVGSITTTSEEDIDHNNDAKQWFSDYDIKIIEINVSTDSYETILSKISESQLLFVSGHNVFYLLQEILKKRVHKFIANQVRKGKVYIGEGAGSMILAPSIAYAEYMNDSSLAPDLKTYKGLNVIDFYPVPHYHNDPYRLSSSQTVNEYKNKLHIIPFSDNQVIVVNGNQKSVLDYLHL